jgi:class 3 adenylate cyclase/tetratricopeptide (TPR) repeat protein
LRGLLGEGARKRVYAGLDTRLGREVAVAVVKTEGLDDAGRQRVEREARAMAMLGDHPHIVTVHDVGEDEGVPYIVSQLMPGGSLANVLAKASEHRLSVDDTVRIGSQVAEALAHAHGHGVIHRDLKPANIWLDANGAVLLGDFGLAAMADHSALTAEGLVVGTVAYLAPEQGVGRTADARADLYSLGAVLYELLCGRPPFLGEDAVAIISQHLNTVPVAPSWHNAGVPEAMDGLVLSLLAKDPGERPASAGAVIEELSHLVQGPALATIAPTPASVRLMPVTRRLVGRAAELAQLTSAFDDAVSGRGHLVMVVGEPGIGKSRLVEELAVYAGIRGAAVCWGHCYEGELAMPYLPFVEAFRSYVRDRPDDELRTELSGGAPEVATLVSELRQRFADLPDSPALEGDAERMRLFEGVATFLRNASADRPIVLLLDDLHWADKASLLMLQYLARNLRGQRILLVGTYRDVELDRTHPLAEAVASLRHERLFDRVLLRGLTVGEVKSLIDAIDDQDSPLAFAEIIHRETEGNPFFVAEILRHLVETGVIAKVEGTWVGTIETIADNLPEGIREVIGRRLSRLSAGCNRMLGVAAAMPGGFSLEVVAAVLDADEEQTLDYLDEALGVQVLRERREKRGTYEFSHALIRQTLYAELSTPRRVRLHRQIASALESRKGGEADLGELAYHCFQGAPGGDVPKAVDYATRAAERARSQAAHEEAARFYDMALQALELAEQPDLERRAELLLACGASLNWAGETERVAEVLSETTELARTLGDTRLFARVALAAAGLRFGGAIHEPALIALLAEAAAGLGETDDALLARVLAREAQYHSFIDQDRVVALAAEAVVAARRSGDPRALAAALSAWNLGLTAPDQADERRQTRAEIRRLAEEAGELEIAFANQTSLVIEAEGRSDRTLLDGALPEVVRLATQSRSPDYLSTAAQIQCGLAALEGRYEDAERFASEVGAYGHRLRDPVMVNNVGAILFPVWRERGRAGEFESATRRAIQESPGVVAYRAGLALLLCDIGQHQEAADHLEILAANGFAEIPDDVTRTFNLCESAEVAVALGDTVRAVELVGLLRPRAGMASAIGSFAYHGAVDRYLGLLELCVGHHDEAVADLERALAIHDGMRARPWSARTRYDLARALLARGDPGDRQRAVALLNDALETANSVGMPRLIEESLAVKLDLQGVASSSPQASIDVVAAGVSVERPDLSSHAAADGRVVIVFSDIEGYSAMTERLGDDRAQALLREHNGIVRGHVRAHGGVEVKSQGDGFMLAFRDPHDALASVVAIQRAVAEHDFDGEQVRLRIGIHIGEVIEEADDFYGRTVIIAARVADCARGGEVLVTSEVCEAVPDVSVDARRQVMLKGLSHPQMIHTLIWQHPA